MSKSHVTTYRGIKIHLDAEKGYYRECGEGEFYASLERISQDIDSFLKFKAEEHADWCSQYG